MPVTYNQSGYVGSSMSERAMEAYENGEAPKSKWSKTAMLAKIEDYCYDNDYLINADNGSVNMTPFEKMTKTDLFDKFFEYTSWHHTSKYANGTDFFGLDEDELENTITDENFPENLPKPKKRVSNRVNGLIPFVGLNENGILYFYADKTLPKTSVYKGKNLHRIFTVPRDGLDDGFGLVDPAPWRKNERVARSIKRVYVTKSFSKIPVRSLCYWFEGLHNCREIDVSNLDISNVTNMGCMFCNCSSLTTIKGLKNFDTSNVKDMRRMFTYCSSLTTLDLSNFNTSNVEDMSFMFEGCSSLKTLDLSGWDTSNVEDMEFMFADCTSLENVDGLMGWDTSNVVNMEYMFLRCNKISKNNRQLLRKYWDITKK